MTTPGFCQAFLASGGVPRARRDADDLHAGGARAPSVHVIHVTRVMDAMYGGPVHAHDVDKTEHSNGNSDRNSIWYRALQIGSTRLAPGARGFRSGPGVPHHRAPGRGASVRRPGARSPSEITAAAASALLCEMSRLVR